MTQIFNRPSEKNCLRTQIYNSIFSHLLRHYCKRAYGFDFALQEPANNVLLSFCCQFN